MINLVIDLSNHLLFYRKKSESISSMLYNDLFVIHLM